MPRYKVVVSSRFEGGDTVRVNSGIGTVNVRIPRGVKPGDSIVFNLPEVDVANAKHRKTTGAASSIYEGKVQNDSKHNLEELVVDGVKLKATGSRRLFGYDIEGDCSELGVALCLGFAVGISIFLGFITGILFATKPNFQQDFTQSNFQPDNSRPMLAENSLTEEM